MHAAKYLATFGLLVGASGCSSSPRDEAGQAALGGSTALAAAQGGASSMNSNQSSGGATAMISGGATTEVATNRRDSTGGANATSSANAGRGGASAAPVAGSTAAGATRGGRSSSDGGRSTGGNALVGGRTTSSAVSGGRAAGGATAAGGRATGGTSSNTTTFSVAGGGGCLDGPAVVVPSGYRLVWADEFNVVGAPDSTNWGYETGFVRNEEAQWYQSDNAWVEQGCLVIEGRRERKTNPNYKSGSSDWKTNRQYAEYTSSSLRTMGKKSWQYGRLEMRGRIKAQTGLWPAWWTLGVAGEWPSCGEVDIMEFYGAKIRANVACGTATQWQAKWDSVAVDVTSLGNSNWDNEFHVWRMDWDDTKIDLMLDDKVLNTSKLSDMLNPDGSSPFKQPHYMLINLAIGGQNGGDPAKTTFPTRYEVDYVRVYQKQ